MEREVASFTCPQCGRRITVLADEYGDHGCSCGWEITQNNEGDDAE